MARDTDVIVIGAGMVGLACAAKLAAQGRGVVVLERHERFGVETSSRNSEVVHAGMYYTPGSLKASLCTAGNRATWDWCARHAVPCRKTGKLIVATEPAEEAALEALLERGRANGVARLREVSLAETRTLEPNVRCTAALLSEDTGIIDSHALMRSLVVALEASGGQVVYRQEIVAAEQQGERGEGRGYSLVARDESGGETRITTAAVVNSAGLDADRVAALPGLDIDAAGYRQHWARGRYFRVAARKAKLAGRLIYPVPAAAHLGIHVTLDLGGGMRLGPDIEYLAKREQDYRVDPAAAPSFHEAASRYLTGLEPGDLAPDQAGIRPKLQEPGGPPRDFVIAEESERGGGSRAGSISSASSRPA